MNFNHTYKCPYCAKYFNPKRLNQIYCETKHGWMHRNLLKTSTNKDDVKSQLGLLSTLKNLNKFSFSSCKFVDKEILDKLITEKSCLKPIKSPETEPSAERNGKWFEVYGYAIELFDNGHCILYKPTFFKV